MSDRQGPAVTRRKLTHELRELRERAGLPQAAVVENFDWSLSKLIRIENGTVGVSVTDLMALCTLYGVPTDKVSELVALSRLAKTSRWWTSHRHVVPTLSYKQFLGFEADATHIRLFQPSTVPGLLQVEGYVRAVTNGLSLEPKEEAQAEQLVEVRQRRQSEVLGGSHPPKVTVLLDEAVLRRQVGGPAVMSDQLRHLARLQDNETISLGILAFSAGAHFGMTGPFHILELDDVEATVSAENAVLYVENAQGSLALQDKPDLVAKYQRQFDAMLDRSVHGPEAIEFLKTIIHDMEART